MIGCMEFDCKKSGVAGGREILLKKGSGEAVSLHIETIDRDFDFEMKNY